MNCSNLWKNYKRNMEIVKNKIGCALITCDRLDFYKKSCGSLLNSIKHKNIECVVVNDGIEKIKECEFSYIETTGKCGVSVAKNKGLEFLIKSGCEHIFLMEDDIQITNGEVFQAYIDASKKTGIKHFNYALHGNHNLNRFGEPDIRKTVKYPNGIEVDLYSNVLGAFSYYHIDVLNDIGLFDDGYYNAMEHVKHTYDASLKDYTTPWRWFVDIHNSTTYLKDIVPDHQQSKIRNDSDFQNTFKKGLDRFIEQTGFSVVHGYGKSEPIISEEECLKNLRKIWKKYHQE